MVDESPRLAIESKHGILGALDCYIEVAVWPISHINGSVVDAGRSKLPKESASGAVITHHARIRKRSSRHVQVSVRPKQQIVGCEEAAAARSDKRVEERPRRRVAHHRS